MATNTDDKGGLILAANLSLGSVLFAIAFFSILSATETVFGPSQYIGLLIGATGLLSFWASITSRSDVFFIINAGLGVVYSCAGLIGAVMHWQARDSLFMSQGFTQTSAELTAMGILGMVFIMIAFSRSK